MLRKNKSSSLLSRTGQVLAIGVMAIWLSGYVGIGEGHRMQSIHYRSVIDLSHTISPQIPLWPGDPQVAFNTMATMEEDGYYLRSFAMGEHSATHMNAPNSFHADGQGIDAYEPATLVRPAALIDVRHHTAHNADYVISVQDILSWERRHGRLRPGTVVLFYTGWQERWADPDAFMNADDSGNLHFPGVGAETTRFLLQRRDIAGVGIDTHGVDPGLDPEFATNTQVLAENGIILENLTRLDQLPPTGATIVIGLLRLKDGSGSPVSVMAFAP